MGEISFWYFWTIWLRKKLKKLILKKGKISGLASNWHIFLFLIFFVHIFLQNHFTFQNWKCRRCSEIHKIGLLQDGHKHFQNWWTNVWDIWNPKLANWMILQANVGFGWGIGTSSPHHLPHVESLAVHGVVHEVCSNFQNPHPFFPVIYVLGLIWDIVFEILTTNEETTPDVTTS